MSNGIQLVIEETTTTLEPVEDVVTILEVGMQGPPGAASGSYTHVQSSASTQWTINHNLGFNPNIELRTTGGQVMFAEIVHTTVNQAIAYFNATIAGSATCS